MYLTKLETFVDDEYGQRIRQQFQDNRGSSELAMLETPNSEELAQLKKAVAIMTEKEKQNAEYLSDEDILRITEDAKIDSGIFAIFINGYALEYKKA